MIYLYIIVFFAGATQDVEVVATGFPNLAICQSVAASIQTEIDANVNQNAFKKTSTVCEEFI